MSGVNPNSLQPKMTPFVKTVNATATDAGEFRTAISVYSVAQVDSLLSGLGALTAEDIDTLAEINAILTDADIASVTYVDALAANYATTEQGDTADSALQPEDITSGTITAGTSDINLSSGSEGNALIQQPDGSFAMSAIPSPDVSGLVPYTGAVANLNLGDNALQLGDWVADTGSGLQITKGATPGLAAIRITTESDDTYTHVSSATVIGIPLGNTGTAAAYMGAGGYASALFSAAFGGARVESAGSYGCAMGQGAVVNASSGTAVGRQAIASTANGTAIGYNAVANGTIASGEVAIGGGALRAPTVVETYKTSTLNPTTTDIPAGTRRAWYNSALGEFRDWANIGGTLYKSAAYTL